MSTVVALLRGVNIGGVRFAMRDLAATLTAAGFTDVRTVLASGNVVLGSESGPADAARGIEAAILDRFGFDVSVIAVPPDRVRAAVTGYPFPRVPGRHAYAVFATDPAALPELATVAGPLDPTVERVAVGDGVLYWDAPKGETLQTAFGRQYGRRQRSGAVTTRNLNTLEKILAVLP